MEKDSKNISRYARIYSRHENATPERVAELLFEFLDPKFHADDLTGLNPIGIPFTARSHSEFGADGSYGGFPGFAAIFQGAADVENVNPPSPDAVSEFERELNDRSNGQSSEKSAEVFFCHRQDESWWFLIWRGESDQCEGERSCRKFDSLVYYPLTGELQVRSCLKGEKDLYRDLVGSHFFEDEEFFAHQNQYSLEPLRRHGRDSLACSDIEGLEWVKLTKVCYHLGGPEEETETYLARDLFSVIKKKKILSKAKIIWAGFQMKFSGFGESKELYIHSSGIAGFDRDESGWVIEDWMRKRNFLTNNCGEKKEAA